MRYLQGKWKWKIAETMLMAALSMFFLSACGGSSKPTAADAQAIFEDIHKDLKVISFKATKVSEVREVEVEGKNRKVALIDYEAEVECLQDTYLDNGPCKKGDKQTVKGFINFKNDGDGWKEPGP